MIIVLGSVIAREGRLDEALSLSREHVARSRAEPGCVAHAVHVDGDNASRLVFVERWATHAALWAHFQVPESRAFGKALAGLAAERPEMTIYEASLIPTPGRREAEDPG